MGAGTGNRLRKTRMAPGAFRCPSCRHYVPVEETVECIRADRKRGKIVCMDCGVSWLKNHETLPRDHKGPVQSKGQQSLQLKGNADNGQE